MTDHDLLRQYASDRSQPAFAELVRRHAEWVRAAAARQVRDTHLAEDVTQAVFMVLAKKAPSFGEGKPLAAWLFGVLRLVTRRALRDEQRRRHHERRAAQHAMANAARMSPDEQVLAPEEWAEVSRVLDESVARLPAPDRDAVLLRFYQRKNFADVGAALGGVSEEAARKRVTRAVDRLRERLSHSGPALGSERLAPALWSMTTPTIEQAGTVSTLASAADAAAGGTLTTGKPLALAKGAMKMAMYSAMRIPAACTAAVAVVASFAMLNRGAAPGDTSVVIPATTPAVAAMQAASTVPTAVASGVAVDPAPPPPQPQQKTILDKVVPGIRGENPVAGDDILELLQDSASVTITIDWGKLGTRGDKGLTLDLKPMPLRDMLAEILKAAGARKPAKMTVEGTKVHVTAAPDEDRK